jgi:DNA polymerase I-like protein with 3'-5' exonuclease and polymerase domains
MNIITIDFETYFSKDYGFAKMTTEEYVRDDQFEVVGVAVKVGEEETEWFSGSFEETKKFLSKYDWGSYLVLAHNTLFDGAIMSWHFKIKPLGWLDTLSMARALDGAEVGNSLGKLADRYALGTKGDDTLWSKGLRRLDFSPEQLTKYGNYCKNDVELTYKLFNILKEGFTKKELKLIDLTLSMFIEPTLELNLPLLEQHLIDVVERKEKLIAEASSDRDTLLSNPKFAERLQELGVEPPMKISPTTGKATLALAKSDEGFKALAEHPDERVQALVAARLGTKSTLEETRTQRFIEIAKRGKMPVPLRYYAAHTGRWGGDDKLNLQNLPSRGKDKNTLKTAICPPPGHVLIDSDSSQIEARIVAWLSGQKDLVLAFEEGRDVYKLMAGKIYLKNPSEVTEDERFVGKTTILGAGYGMGAMKFQMQLKTFGVELSLEFCRKILHTFRTEFGHIPRLWDQANDCITLLAQGDIKAAPFGIQPQATYFMPGVGFEMPSGIPQKYPEIGFSKVIDPVRGTQEIVYSTRKGPSRIYGGKVVENICQGLARCVIGEQMLKIAQRYKVVLTVHDAVACIAPIAEAEEAARYVQECMRWRPKWAETLPLNCEVKMGDSYGGAKKWKG